MTEIPLNDKIAFLESLIVVNRSAGNNEIVRYLAAICTDLRAMTQEIAHKVHRALSHQVQAARKHRDMIPPSQQEALIDAFLAHWPTIQHALRSAARHEELSALADLYQRMAHDCAPEDIVAAIHAKFPNVAKEWEGQL